MKPRKTWLMAGAAIVMVPVLGISQGSQTLILSGHEGSVPVTQTNGRTYVEVEALARLANGSVSFHGSQVVLTLPAGSGGSAESAPQLPAASGFSKGFLRAGIEAMATIREWHSALASAIENSYPITQDWLSPYQGQAGTNLRLAQVAITTDDDKSAFQLLSRVFQKMKQLNDKYVAAKANMSYIAPNSLQRDELNQSIVSCGKALAAMAANGQFSDTTSCH